MSDVGLMDAPVDAPTAPPVDDPAAAGWRQDKQGRWYVPRRGDSGIVYRKGNETPEEAHHRDAKSRAQPKDKRPKGKPKEAPKAPAPTRVDAKQLEMALREAFEAPSMIAAMQGDRWAADHFVRSAPALARNLVVAAEHNPWLQRRLEAMMVGDALVMKLATLVPVLSAAIAYLLPPVIYYFDPGFIPAGAREMFQVPQREEEQRRRAQEERDAQAAQRAQQQGPTGPEAAAAT